MAQSLLALVLIASMVALPLGWRAWQDRREARALAVRAEVHAALVAAFGGESLIALHVASPLPWREGRIILSGPMGSESMIRAAWRAVMAKRPPGYDLVVRSGDPRAVSPALLAWGRVA